MRMYHIMLPFVSSAFMAGMGGFLLGAKVSPRFPDDTPEGIIWLVLVVIALGAAAGLKVGAQTIRSLLAKAPPHDP